MALHNISSMNYRNFFNLNSTFSIRWNTFFTLFECVSVFAVSWQFLCKFFQVIWCSFNLSFGYSISYASHLQNGFTANLRMHILFVNEIKLLLLPCAIIICTIMPKIRLNSNTQRIPNGSVNSKMVKVLKFIEKAHTIPRFMWAASLRIGKLLLHFTSTVVDSFECSFCADKQTFISQVIHILPIT